MMGASFKEEIRMTENELQEKKDDRLQKINVPKCIKVLSLVYIGATVLAGFFTLSADILEQGHITASQAQYAIGVLQDVITGFLFWGVGQVFAKFMENKR